MRRLGRPWLRLGATPARSVLGLEPLGTIQQAVPEQFELRYKLLDPRTQQECMQCGIIPVATCTFDIRNLLPNRAYKFTVKRASEMRDAVP